MLFVQTNFEFGLANGLKHCSVIAWYASYNIPCMYHTFIKYLPTYRDQMTRKNIELARGLRIDDDSVTQGLKVQYPMICAPWHTKQDIQILITIDMNIANCNTIKIALTSY